MTDIVLATVNARWIHAAFGLRCLRANLGPLRDRSVLREFDLQARPADVVEALLRDAPRIVGLSVYVWNAAAMAAIVAILRRVAPDVAIVLGGPEVSHETDRQPFCRLADYVVRGEGDLLFRDLCERLLRGERPEARVLDAPLPHFEQLAWPYDEYTDADLAHRVVYVEASRGCPFTCEFCLSALDVPVRQAPLQPFLEQLRRLLDRGLRHFKFVDRTFNLRLDTSRAILDFFRAEWRDGLFLHFEMVPDRLPAGLREAIAALPRGSLQFEVGVQTLDDEVGARIARRQDNGKLADNLAFLREAGVHVHADLIVGLPGETMAGFGRGFDRLLAMGPDEIQVGVLKRLRGTPIVRHDDEWQVVWSDEPPYEVLHSRALPFADLQRLKRFARYWDVVANSGRWRATLALLLAGDSAFARFLAFADWLHETAQTTHGIQKHRLAALLCEWLVQHGGVASEAAGAALAADYLRGGGGDWPEFLRPFVQPAPATGAAGAPAEPAAARGNPAATRQARHRA